MKILFIVPYVPNLIRVRPYNLIRSLSAKGHHVTLVTLWGNDKEFEDVQQLNAICDSIIAFPLSTWRSLANCVPTLLTTTPLQAKYSFHPLLAKKLYDLVNHGSNHYDLVHVEHIRGAEYGLRLKLNNNHQNSTLVASRIPVVWDSVDCISHLFRQSAKQSKRLVFKWLTWLELHRTERFESLLIKSFDHTFVTSKTDKEALAAGLENNNLSSKISVVPNGVDLAYFTSGLDEQREPATLIVTGKMSYHANVSMVHFLASEVMPRLWTSNPEIRLWIVGKDPPKQIKALTIHPQITVTGTVSDLRPYLQKATIAVAPVMYGAGIQNKVLESMACATPVVTSTKAISALDALPGRDLVVANDPQDFVNSILSLMENRDLRKHIGDSGRKYVENNHRWEDIVDKLEEIYENTCARARYIRRI